jgi:hypothetical protein
MSEKTIITRPGWEIVMFDDGTINICTLADDLLLSPSEFDKLALQSPLVQRMVKILKTIEGRDACQFCDIDENNHIHQDDCYMKQLLAEIEKLEAK